MADLVIAYAKSIQYPSHLGSYRNFRKHKLIRIRRSSRFLIC